VEAEVNWLEWLVFIIGVIVVGVFMHFLGWVLLGLSIGVCLFILLIVKAARNV
jgi:hypothetical protein